jgi:hypothetical protein
VTNVSSLTDVMLVDRRGEYGVRLIFFRPAAIAEVMRSASRKSSILSLVPILELDRPGGLD